MIVSSTHSVGHTQADGRSYVTELHTDSVGIVHRVEYLAEMSADYVAMRTARAEQLSISLADREAEEIIGGD